MFIFNIKFGDFIDIIIFKKRLEDLYNDYQINKYNINYMKIEENITVMNEISKEIIEKNGANYFSYFIFYFYNYKRWFHLKRNKDEKNTNK